MNRYLCILSLFLLLSQTGFGQKKQFKEITNEELKLINDLSSTFTDTSLSFAISPLILFLTDTSSIDFKELEKIGFDFDFSTYKKDSLLIKENDNFKIINLDSLIKYQNKEFSVDFRMQNGIDLFQTPLRYFVDKNYHKEGVCYFYKPIFSKNNHYAIIEYWIDGGTLCGWGEIVLMKKEKDKWIKVETLVFNES